MGKASKSATSVGMLYILAGGSLALMAIMMMRVQPLTKAHLLLLQGEYVPPSSNRELASPNNMPFPNAQEEEEPYPCIPRPQKYQDKVNKRIKDNKKPLIYFHEGPNSTVSLREMYFADQEPRDCFDCEWTEDKNRQIEADVVVVVWRKEIEYLSRGMERLPPKYCGQLFVMLHTESPNNLDPRWTPAKKYAVSRIFDISSSYRLDSDLPRPYKSDVIKLLKLAQEKALPAKDRDSEFPVAWIASRCDTTNERMAYVKELMKHIGVKSYGTCLNNAQMAVNRKGDNWQGAADKQIGKHKFYLSFENSNCDYYITEKLYRPLKIGVIPVVMGAPQAKLYVPNNHSALFVHDFESPAALAKRLHEINDSNDLFDHYTSFLHDSNDYDIEFRNRWLRKRPPHACQLCDLVKSSFGKNFKGVPYEHWTACEQKHGTWKTNFQPIQTSNGIVPKLKITGH